MLVSSIQSTTINQQLVPTAFSDVSELSFFSTEIVPVVQSSSLLGYKWLLFANSAAHYSILQTKK